MERLNLLLTEGPSLIYCEFKTKDVAKTTKKSSPIECHFSLEISINRESKEVMAALSVKSESENIPFDFDVKSHALFKVDKFPSGKANEEAFEKKAISEAIPYIFSFLKEIVADLTRKAYLKPFYLPPIELDTKNFEKVKKQ
jgi:preprotein translocase subunit SecB